MDETPSPRRARSRLESSVVRKPCHPRQEGIAVETRDMSCRHSRVARNLTPLGKFEVQTRPDVATKARVIFTGRVRD